MRSTFLHLILSAGILSGCVTDQGGQEGPNKQTLGAIVGGIAGAVLGSRFGSGKGKIAAVAAGTLAGAWLGSEIGASLDRADKLAIERESARALASAGDGQTISWRNPDSGVSARITPVNSRVEERPVIVVRPTHIAPPPPLVLIGESYEAKKNANLRAAPSTRHAVVGGLRAGEVFDAIGYVRGSDWILAAKGNRSIGYVFGPLVQPAAGKQAPELRSDPINLDEIKLGEDVVADHVMAQTKCRTIDYTVTTKDGKKGRENFDACKSSNGAWEIL